MDRIHGSSTSSDMMRGFANKAAISVLGGKLILGVFGGAELGGVGNHMLWFVKGMAAEGDYSPVKMFKIAEGDNNMAGQL